MAELRPLDEEEAEARVHGVCFKHGPPRRLGVELEWILHDKRDPAAAVAPRRLAAAHAAVRDLPLSSAVTSEPGGQLELSSAPAESLNDAVEAVRADLELVRELLARHDLTAVGYGQEPWNPPRRTLDLPRYAAMERYFDRTGTAGRAMMGGSASVQVCLDAGIDDSAAAQPAWNSARARWRRAHLLGPLLVAAFANSPLAEGRSTGYRSTRQTVWSRLDPGRVTAPDGADRSSTDPRAAWARYALDAPVLCIRGEGPAWDVPLGLSFREWIRDLHRVKSPRPPTRDDLDYHLTTLFPPVRPHGHLELRMIDAQAGDDGWIVPVAVTAALMEDRDAARAAESALAPLAERPAHRAPDNPLWRRAARDALTDPALHQAATACFAAAEDALPRLGAGAAIRAAVAEFRGRYVEPGRCPADDLLDLHRAAPAAARRAGSPARRAHAPASVLTGKDDLR